MLVIKDRCVYQLYKHTMSRSILVCKTSFSYYRRRSISPRRNFRDERMDRDRFGGGPGGRFDRDRGFDRRSDRDRYTRRY